jgi:hypothetical protein
MRGKYKQHVRYYNQIQIPDYNIFIFNKSKMNKKYIKLKPFSITIIYFTARLTGFDLIFLTVHDCKINILRILIRILKICC